MLQVAKTSGKAETFTKNTVCDIAVDSVSRSGMDKGTKLSSIELNPDCVPTMPNHIPQCIPVEGFSEQVCEVRSSVESPDTLRDVQQEEYLYNEQFIEFGSAELEDVASEKTSYDGGFNESLFCFSDTSQHLCDSSNENDVRSYLIDEHREHTTNEAQQEIFLDVPPSETLAEKLVSLQPGSGECVVNALNNKNVNFLASSSETVTDNPTSQEADSVPSVPAFPEWIFIPKSNVEKDGPYSCMYLNWPAPFNTQTVHLINTPPMSKLPIQNIFLVAQNDLARISKDVPTGSAGVSGKTPIHVHQLVNPLGQCLLAVEATNDGQSKQSDITLSPSVNQPTTPTVSPTKVALCFDTSSECLAEIKTPNCESHGKIVNKKFPLSCVKLVPSSQGLSFAPASQSTPQKLISVALCPNLAQDAQNQAEGVPSISAPSTSVVLDCPGTSAKNAVGVQFVIRDTVAEMNKKCMNLGSKVQKECVEKPLLLSYRPKVGQSVNSPQTPPTPTDMACTYLLQSVAQKPCSKPEGIHKLNMDSNLVKITLKDLRCSSSNNLETSPLVKRKPKKNTHRIPLLGNTIGKTLHGKRNMVKSGEGPMTTLLIQELETLQGRSSVKTNESKMLPSKEISYEVHDDGWSNLRCGNQNTLISVKPKKYYRHMFDILNDLLPPTQQQVDEDDISGLDTSDSVASGESLTSDISEMVNKITNSGIPLPSLDDILVTEQGTPHPIPSTLITPSSLTSFETKQDQPSERGEGDNGDENTLLSSSGNMCASPKSMLSMVSPPSEKSLVLHLFRLPFIENSGEYYIPWVEIREVLFPLCRNTQCKYMFNATMDALVKDTSIQKCGAYSKPVSHKLTEAEVLHLAEQFFCVPCGDVAFNLDVLRPHIQNIYSQIYLEHRQFSACPYQMTQKCCFPSNLDVSSNLKYSNSAYNSKKGTKLNESAVPLTGSKKPATRFIIHGQSDDSIQDNTCIKQSQSVRQKSPLATPAPDVRFIRGKVRFFGETMAGCYLGPVPNQTKGGKKLDLYIPVVDLARCFPLMVDYLTKLCRTFVLHQSLKSRIAKNSVHGVGLRVNTPEEAHELTKWRAQLCTTQPDDRSWRYLTSRSILVNWEDFRPVIHRQISLAERRLSSQSVPIKPDSTDLKKASAHNASAANKNLNQLPRDQPELPIASENTSSEDIVASRFDATTGKPLIQSDTVLEDSHQQETGLRNVGVDQKKTAKVGMAYKRKRSSPQSEECKRQCQVMTSELSRSCHSSNKILETSQRVEENDVTLPQDNCDINELVGHGKVLQFGIAAAETNEELYMQEPSEEFELKKCPGSTCLVANGENEQINVVKHATPGRRSENEHGNLACPDENLAPSTCKPSESPNNHLNLQSYNPSQTVSMAKRNAFWCNKNKYVQIPDDETTKASHGATLLRAVDDRSTFIGNGTEDVGIGKPLKGLWLLQHQVITQNKGGSNSKNTNLKEQKQRNLYQGMFNSKINSSVEIQNDENVTKSRENEGATGTCMLPKPAAISCKKTALQSAPLRTPSSPRVTCSGSVPHLEMINKGNQNKKTIPRGPVPLSNKNKAKGSCTSGMDNVIRVKNVQTKPVSMTKAQDKNLEILKKSLLHMENKKLYQKQESQNIGNTLVDVGTDWSSGEPYTCIHGSNSEKSPNFKEQGQKPRNREEYADKSSAELDVVEIQEDLLSNTESENSSPSSSRSCSQSLVTSDSGLQLSPERVITEALKGTENCEEEHSCMSDNDEDICIEVEPENLPSTRYLPVESLPLKKYILVKEWQLSNESHSKNVISKAKQVCTCFQSSPLKSSLESLPLKKRYSRLYQMNCDHCRVHGSQNKQPSDWNGSTAKPLVVHKYVDNSSPNGDATYKKTHFKKVFVGKNNNSSRKSCISYSPQGNQSPVSVVDGDDLYAHFELPYDSDLLREKYIRIGRWLDADTASSGSPLLHSPVINEDAEKQAMDKSKHIADSGVDQNKKDKKVKLKPLSLAEEQQKILKIIKENQSRIIMTEVSSQVQNSLTQCLLEQECIRRTCAEEISPAVIDTLDVQSPDKSTGKKSNKPPKYGKCMDVEKTENSKCSPERKSKKNVKKNNGNAIIVGHRKHNNHTSSDEGSGSCARMLQCAKKISHTPKPGIQDADNSIAYHCSNKKNNCNSVPENNHLKSSLVSSTSEENLKLPQCEGFDPYKKGSTSATVKTSFPRIQPSVNTEYRLTSCFDEETGESKCGFLHIQGLVMPYVLRNGYKFFLVKDACKLFPKCCTGCSIPRKILTKTRILCCTMCSFDEVYLIDLIWKHKGSPICSGDLLIRLDTTLKLFEELKAKVRDEHWHTKSKRSAQCNY